MEFRTVREVVERARARAEHAAQRARAMRSLMEMRPAASGPAVRHVCDAALDELTKAARERDRVFAVLSHELRQSVNAALGAMRVATVVPDAGRRERATAVLERQLVQLAELVDRLLDFSRLSLDPLTVSFGLIDIVELVRGAIDTARAGDTAAEKGHVFTLESPDGPITIRGDAVRLRQLFSNLLSNAVTHTPPGGRIHVAVTADDDEVIVRVRDSGDGIAPEHVDRIFEPFVRYETGQRGLGIGLAVVRRVAELHGGQVSVESNGARRGAEFRLVLPRAGSAPA